MTTLIKTSAILLVLFLTIVLLNEYNRAGNSEIWRDKQGITRINSTRPLTEKCTWFCHDNTNHCKSQHVKRLQRYFSYTDPLYFGLIGSMKNTGLYAFANVLLLALVIPFIVTYLFVRVVDMQRKINRLKQKK
jgi:hypothetical protein